MENSSDHIRNVALYPPIRPFGRDAVFPARSLTLPWMIISAASTVRFHIKLPKWFISWLLCINHESKKRQTRCFRVITRRLSRRWCLKPRAQRMQSNNNTSSFACGALKLLRNEEHGWHFLPLITWKIWYLNFESLYFYFYYCFWNAVGLRTSHKPGEKERDREILIDT